MNKNILAVYCKCEKQGIIFIATEDEYNEKSFKDEVDSYLNKGHKIGKVSRTEAEEKRGCECICKKENCTNEACCEGFCSAHCKCLV
jgi:two-component SAPR family response regulator